MAAEKVKLEVSPLFSHSSRLFGYISTFDPQLQHFNFNFDGQRLTVTVTVDSVCVGGDNR